MTLRQDIVDNAHWGVANEPSIHYSQGGSRFAALHDPRTLPLYTDCSAFATLCYAWAGAPDPNGLGYNGTGYTGTLLDHCEHISADELQPGDLVVFGPYPGDHVVVVVDTDADPMCVSHGQEAGPILIRLSREAAAHRPPIFYLRGEGLDTPAEDDMTPELQQALKDMEDRLTLHFTQVLDQIGVSNKRDDGTYEDTGLAGQVHKLRRAVKADYAADGGVGDPES